MLSAPTSPTRAQALDQVAATLLSRTSRLTRLLMRSGPRDLSRTEVGLLSSLADGARRITELAETEALAQPSISRLVDGLEERGLVTRQRSADDRRVVLVAISPDGQAHLDAVRGQIGSLLLRTLRELDDDELAALVTANDVLARLIESLLGDRGAE